MWRDILEETRHTIEILNNHRNLTYFQDIPEPEPLASTLVPLPVQI